VFLVKRRGGNEWDKEMPHSEWIKTVQAEPDVISMSFLPVTSLLNGVPGVGFVSHAINMYLRCKFVSHNSFCVTDHPFYGFVLLTCLLAMLFLFMKVLLLYCLGHYRYHSL